MIQTMTRVTVTKDDLTDLKRRLQETLTTEVLVGVPASKTERPETDGEPESITNAQLVYIHTKGWPLSGLPARPIIEPAINAEKNREKIMPHFGEALKAALEQNPGKMEQELRYAGQEGENAARSWFLDPDNHWPALSDRTIEERARKKYNPSSAKTAQGREKIVSKMQDYIQNGTFNPLIDTGILRKSIIYVLRKKER